MRILALVVTIALAGCSGAEEETVVAEPVAVEAAAPVAMAADGGPATGTFEIAHSDGRTGTFVANEDGTYDYTGGDGVASRGTWRSDGPNRWCETAEGATEETCFAEAVAEDGTWTSVNEADPEDRATVRRMN